MENDGAATPDPCRYTSKGPFMRPGAIVGLMQGRTPMIIIIDTREQIPYTFAEYDVDVQPATLAAGDYSLAGLECLAAIERKELSDLIGCITTGRDRFTRELQRLKAYRCRAVIIEADVGQVYAGDYRSKVKPQSVIGSISSWQTRYGVPFVWAGNRDQAEDMTFRLLHTFHRQIEELVQAVSGPARRPATASAQQGG